MAFLAIVEGLLYYIFNSDVVLSVWFADLPT